MVRSWLMIALAALLFISQAVVAEPQNPVKYHGKGNEDTSTTMCPAAVHGTGDQWPCEQPTSTSSPDVPAPAASENGYLPRVACSSEKERERKKIIEETTCGAPKDVFIRFQPNSSHEQVSPGAVWVKRCVGLCDFSGGTECAPSTKRTIYLPVRVYNVIRDREECSSYPMEEHVSCDCRDT